ncbi:ferredoxin--NADP reductase [Roseimarinus sediminis]|uniref:ferredoxin--NADP reductase n=1 Tax=Roseimarinus sediminis TaxID=1610899 RepID=UPI003D20BA12
MMIKEEKSVGIDQLDEHPVFRVQALRHLTKSAYVLRFDRNNMEFIAGQHLSVGLAGDPQAREYSIYSSVNDPYLEILVKEVENGIVSKRLKRVKPGDELRVTGPMGFFKLKKDRRSEKPHLFVGTGTGISPFHSFIKSYPELNYQLIHGVRHVEEAYEKDEYPPGRYTLCTSRDRKGNFSGRTSDYLKTQNFSSDTEVYLCGNCDMIFEVYDILTDKGIPTENIHTEVYF